jgi:hypothetical protein
MVNTQNCWIRCCLEVRPIVLEILFFLPMRRRFIVLPQIITETNISILCATFVIDIKIFSFLQISFKYHYKNLNAQFEILKEIKSKFTTNFNSEKVHSARNTQFRI